MKESCSSTSECCEIETAAGRTPNQACGTGSGDPVEKSMSAWTRSFFLAMQEIQTDLLKSKIQKAWGGPMDKTADAVLQAMGTIWQSMLAETEAKSRLAEQMKKIFQEAKGHS